MPITPFGKKTMSFGNIGAIIVKALQICYNSIQCPNRRMNFSFLGICRLLMGTSASLLGEYRDAACRGLYLVLLRTEARCLASECDRGVLAFRTDQVNVFPDIF